MSKFGVLAMGPAGAGKTTFCTALIQHLQHTHRSCFYVNLDPAATSFAYTPDLDIRDLISLEDVMDEMSLGPNGGLIFCFEFLLQNLDFLATPIESLTEEFLIIFDLPGQIELYTHIPLLPELIRYLSRMGPLNINLCAAYLLEATMSAMVNMELPHINILSKMDLVQSQVSRKELRRFTDPDARLLEDEDTGRNALSGKVDVNVRNPAEVDNVMSGGSFKALNRAVARLIDDFSMVSFLQLDVNDEDSVGGILSYIDDAIQYHEAQEPKEPKEFERDFDPDE
ncbi:GPN-loop GTPase 3 [Cyphellophora attinorum]|uniref:GPN-loop GTPase 3 n=1 Tax=Cyphellophora attinorum TaxID=1664694 RepID=A0A0N1H1W6_9EURO|nr:GPN-loop GTPase 3 [Phialophora attinorum]KPI38477.1 GPN-loop GTPase 3 [Phialophora attinorum]